MNKPNLAIVKPPGKPNGKLAPMQQRFIEQYVIDLNGKQSAIRAGYSAHTAEVKASQLLRIVKIQVALARLMEARARDTGLKAAYVIDGLQANLERSATPGDLYNAQAVNRALELLGKHLGMFVDRVDHTGEITIEAIRRTIVDPNDT